jgi:hypothetical protein
LLAAHERAGDLYQRTHLNPPIGRPCVMIPAREANT